MYIVLVYDLGTGKYTRRFEQFSHVLSRVQLNLIRDQVHIQQHYNLSKMAENVKNQQ